MDILSSTVGATAFDPDVAFSAVVNTFNVMMAASSYVNTSWPESSYVKDGDRFDFIVVGCGTAGSVLCNRLSEVPEWRVLCIEAGGDPSLLSVIPAVWPALTHGPMDWDFYSEVDGEASQAQRGGRTTHTAGKVLGGTSAIGHLIHQRGPMHDYAKWSDACEGWDSESTLKYFKKAERILDHKIMSGPTSTFHCDKGPTNAKPAEFNSLLTEKVKVMLDAYEEIGMNMLDDSLIPFPDGTTESLFLITNKENRRSSTAEDYLLPCKDRKNLFVLKEATVTKILTNGRNKATGVNVETKGGHINVFAKEVILSAGVYNSPKLLLLSGIGPKKDLKRLDIPVIQDLPVGHGLQDQLFVPITITGQSDLLSGVTTGLSTNLGSFPGPIVSGLFSSSLGTLDTSHFSLMFGSLTPLFFYLLFVNLNFNLEVSKSLLLSEPEKERMLILSVLAKPKSTGKVTLRSADYRDPPKIYNNYYTDDSDVDRMVEAVKRSIAIQDTSYFTNAGGSFVRPPLPECDCLEFDSDDYWACYVKNMASTLYHTTSTCGMGRVVDASFKVKGVESLRVVDASVMPEVPASATHVPTIMLAEKAADSIKADYGKTEGYKRFPCE